tara:strand:- start:77 stop:244 length:168 start_codon:yes stop_codon:yes gene_type:complete
MTFSYREFSTDINGNTVYARVDADGVVRLTCCAEHPELQEWIAEGNTPEPADSEE